MRQEDKLSVCQKKGFAEKATSLQKFAAVQNLFNTDQGLSSRPVYKHAGAAALAEWWQLRAGRDLAHLPKQRSFKFV